MKQKNVILMVVAVGCGLVAAFLTSQMSAKQVEQVEVFVAAKDLPVGTMLTRADMPKLVKTKKVPKDALPPAFVVNGEDLVDKRLSRSLRAEETFNPQDLSKGGVITLPEGYNMVSLQVGVAQAAAGFVGPGSRVDVLASLRLNNKLKAFPLLRNMLVVAVDTQTGYSQTGTFPTLNTVSFAVKEKQALLLSLAKTRGCTIELMLRHQSTATPEDSEQDLEKTIAFLQDDRSTAKVEGAEEGENTKKQVPPPEVKQPEVKQPETPIAPPPVAKVETVKVLIAKHDIAPNTDITKDLVAEAFEMREFPKDFATDALGDLTEAMGKSFKTGVAKGQWVTPGMVGLQSAKPQPPEHFLVPKPQPSDPKPPVEPKKTPEPPVVKKKVYHDVAIHTPNGTTIVRYEEVAPGKWKKVAELTPEQAAQPQTDGKPDSPKAEPETKKID